MNLADERVKNIHKSHMKNTFHVIGYLYIICLDLQNNYILCEEIMSMIKEEKK